MANRLAHDVTERELPAVQRPQGRRTISDFRMVLGAQRSSHEKHQSQLFLQAASKFLPGTEAGVNRRASRARLAPMSQACGIVIQRWSQAPTWLPALNK